jgi:hypothetical protein
MTKRKSIHLQYHLDRFSNGPKNGIGHYLPGNISKALSISSRSCLLQMIIHSQDCHKTGLRRHCYTSRLALASCSGSGAEKLDGNMTSASWAVLSINQYVILGISDYSRKVGKALFNGKLNRQVLRLLQYNREEGIYPIQIGARRLYSPWSRIVLLSGGCRFPGICLKRYCRIRCVSGLQAGLMASDSKH